MRRWKNKIDLKEVWASNDDKEPEFIDWKDVGEKTAAQIRAMHRFWMYPELERIAKRFEKTRGQKSYDNACTDLWDWGDENDCWISTVL
jgi:hypothetical protein